MHRRDVGPFVILEKESEIVGVQFSTLLRRVFKVLTERRHVKNVTNLYYFEVLSIK